MFNLSLAFLPVFDDGLRFHIDNLVPVKEIVLIMLKGKIKSIRRGREGLYS